MSPRTRTPKSRKSTAAGGKKLKGFTDDERAAMKDRIKELKANTDGESALLEKIAGMKEPERSMAKRIHAVVTAAAPELAPRTWYGMPAYSKDDKVVCFFKAAGKFKARYATLGFSDKANLDKGEMWPTDFALKKVTPAEEKKIAALVKQAVK